NGYNAPIFLGSIAAGGTLGILIPPSVNMIVFALIANVSVPKLYMAATLPALVLTGLFSLFIMVVCFIGPDFAGTRRKITWRERLDSLPHLLPPLGIFALVI